jgi:hypothetical protein
MKKKMREMIVAGHYPQIIAASDRLSSVLAEYGFMPAKVRGVDTSRFTNIKVAAGYSPEEIAAEGAERKAMEIQESFGLDIVIGNMLVVEYEGTTLQCHDVWARPGLLLAGGVVTCHLGVCLRARGIARWKAPVVSKEFRLRTFSSESEYSAVLARHKNPHGIPAVNPFGTGIGDLVENPALLQAFVSDSFLISAVRILLEWHEYMSKVAEEKAENERKKMCSD